MLSHATGSAWSNRINPTHRRTIKLQKSDMMSSLKLADEIDVPAAAEAKKEG